MSDMKRINGTITLSFLEEDNQQRVIFRVVPLCTREGVVFRNKPVDFPDQGSLRIVPDKREQSTFKERMRTMGSLCAIHLCNEGKELTKVRQNRNYDPGQGESNQFAIYSDVICEFSENGVFEVFSDGEDFSAALSARVLVRRGQVLYGPVERDAALDWDLVRPFGNDSYLLHTIELQQGKERSFYWCPEQTVSWRQRRGSLRRNKTRAENAAEESTLTETVSEPEEAIAQTQDDLPSSQAAETVALQPAQVVAAAPVPLAPVRVAEPAVRESVAPVSRAPGKPRLNERPKPPETIHRVARVERRSGVAGDAALPIGTRLNILDESLPFEEQISKLDQPLSMEANLLAGSASNQSMMEPATPPPYFNGTPLARENAKAPRAIRSGEPLHYVVDKQIRSAHREHAELHSDFKHVDNPIENLNVALGKVWDVPETREQAIDALCDNETFTQAFLRRLQSHGVEPKSVAAAQEQLEDIEAERLSLLMQLDAIKNDHRRAMDKLCAEMNQKKKDELAQLNARLETARAELETLNTSMQALGGGVQEQTLEWLAQHRLQLCGSCGDTVALAPTIGEERTFDRMVADVRAAMNRQGFACNEDDVTELLLEFVLHDEICLCGDSLGEAELCAATLLEGLGLSSVSARTDGNTCLQIADMLAGNAQRTPTVEVTVPGRPVLHPYGHKTIRLLDASVAQKDALTLPAVYAPIFRPTLRDRRPVPMVKPVSLASLNALREEAAPLSSQGEAWFEQLDQVLAAQSVSFGGIVTRQMRIFVSVAASRLHGGFLAAADVAMLSWILPVIHRENLDAEYFMPLVDRLPRCMTALGLE